MKKLIILILLITTPAIAQESGYNYINDLNDSGRVILNDQLRRTTRRLRDLEDGRNINTETTGILTTERGGTGQDFSSGTTDTLLYFNYTGHLSLSEASSRTGEFLRDDFTWASADRPIGFQFVQSATFSAQTTISVTQAITSGDIYFIVFEGVVNTAGVQPAIRFNADSSGTNYDYATNSYGFQSATFYATTESSNAADQINLLDIGHANIGTYEQNSTFYIEAKVQARNSSSQVTYKATSYGASSPTMIVGEGIGNYNTAVPASISIVDLAGGGGTYTGRYYVYKYATATYTD